MIGEGDIELIFTIYLDAFASGFATALMNEGYPEADAQRVAVTACAKGSLDPAVAETLRDQIRTRLSGKTNPPITLAVYEP